MYRPTKIQKKEQELLSDTEIFRLIKQHPEVKACSKGLTLEQIRAVFRAYKDIVYTGAKMEKRVSLPCIGQFFSSKEKGWQGGYVNYRTNFYDASTEKRDYFDPKPDYSLLRFDFYKSIRNKFREETEIPLSETVKDVLRQEAEKKEAERLKALENE